MAEEDRKSGEPHADVRRWLNEIASAKKRDDDFRKNGREVIGIYSGDKPDAVPFNIVYSNTETLLPALFSQAPRPVVQRRFKDEDAMGKAAATAAQRMLEYLSDTNVEGYETLEQSMSAATLDGLLPGRGVTSIKYDADVVDPVDADEEKGVAASPGQVNWEQICTDSRKWDGVYFGFARKWSKVPWIAYEEYVDEDEAERLFGEPIAKKLRYVADEQKDDDKDDENKDVTSREDDDEPGRKVALVYQIWDRSGGKKIRYVSPNYDDGYLKVDDDPYQITGFFNCPKPMQFHQKSNDMTPTSMYQLYKNQAEELNNLTRRIKAIVSSIKARGLYDGSLGGDIKTLLESEDLDMVPTDEGATLGQNGGIERAIWMWPVEKLIVVLQQLMQAREACKRVIYEITGVSDIVRGQSVASETLGAQKIKEAWGTMRLKRLQKETQRYARDTLRIMLEVAANKLSVDTWARATGLPFVTADQKMQAQQAQQAAQLAAQQAAQVAQATGQPFQPPQPDPKIQEALNAPVWEDVLALLQDDVQRAYRIDIETNSTIDVEATEDQKNISEVMQAIAQFLHGIGPLVENGTMPFGAAQAFLLTIVRRFRFGTEVEDAIKTMQPPQPKDDGAAKEKELELKGKQMELQQRERESTQKAQIADAQAQRELEAMQQEQEFNRENHVMRMKELRAKGQLNEIVAASKIRVAQATAATKERAVESSGGGNGMQG